MKRMGIGLMALAVWLGGGGQVEAGPMQLITNGDFETGSFAGWTVGSTQATSFDASFNDGKNAQVVNNAGGGPAWYLRNQSETTFSTPATPISGYSAFNGFDGDPGYFYLRQTFSIASPLQSADLGFTYAIQSDYGPPFFSSGTIQRVFDVNILDGSGSILANVYDYARPFGDNEAWSPTAISEDIASALNALGSGTYQLEFRETIPQSYTGPATFAIDNISLNVTSQVNPVPEPASLTVAGLGVLCLSAAAWRRRRQGAAG
jgi:hypothetical protein